MKPLKRLEILIDSAHSHPLEVILRRHSIHRTILLNNVEARGFDTDLRREGYADLLGTSLVIAYAEADLIAAARAELLKFIKKCGGAVFESLIDDVNR